jgi:hypothetical protein
MGLIGGANEMQTANTEMNLEVDDGPVQSDAQDLQSQLEALLTAVWDCERWARTEERIDAAVRYGRI